MDLHIRTEPHDGWAGISNAALRVGKDVLEVVNDGTYFGMVSSTPRVHLPSQATT